ncbi:WD40 repeat domain-containing protein [Streptomyces melanogenes]|uniref:WD40 repeat domain-containing protein n=1 Tax=Streptomyces melanogenes TaxID=67326 RepID=UPI0037BC2E51
MATDKAFATLKGHESGVTWVAFSPDGKSLAASSDNTVQMWDLKAQKAGIVLTAHSPGAGWLFIEQAYAQLNAAKEA